MPMRMKLLFFCLLAAALIMPASAEAWPTHAVVRQENYWTAARLAAAKPLVMPDPDQKTAVVTESASPLSSSVRGIAVEDDTAYPARAMGVLFGALPGPDGVLDYSFRCSATSLTSSLGNLLLTAGHCVDNPTTGSTAADLVFIPGYRDGQEPYGQWPVTSFITTSQWAQSYQSEPDFANDLAILTVEDQTSETGVHSLAEVVGALSPAFNTPREQTYQQYGYPSTYPYDGSSLYELDAAYIGNDAYGVPEPIGVSSDFTPGSSGGAWLSQGAIVGINSYYYPEDPRRTEQMYSPYFGNNAQNLYAAAGGDVPTLPADKPTGQLAPTPVPPSQTPESPRISPAPGGREGSHRQFLKVVKIDTKTDGTALVSVRVPGEGRLKLQGWHMYTQSKRFSATTSVVTLKVKLKPGHKDSRLLNRQHHRWVVIALSYRKNKHDRLFLSRWIKLEKYHGS